MGKRAIRIKNITFDRYIIIYDQELYVDQGEYNLPISLESVIKQKLMEKIIYIEWEDVNG